MNDLKSYFKTKNALSLEEMDHVRSSILSAIEDDDEGKVLFRRLMGKATDYTSIRAGWGSLSAVEKADEDFGRTIAHDSVITHFNMLSKYLENKGRDISWRKILGDPNVDPYNRKRIGDMACYLVFVESLAKISEIT